MGKKSLHDLIIEAHEAGLEGLDFLAKFGFAEIERGYNGIGPEFLPAKVREKITEHLATFEPAAVIHDMRNDVADGTRRSFYRANDEFLRNCLMLADRAYPWWSLRRYRARAVAKALYRFVNAERFGWKAWLEAHDRYISRRGLGTQAHAAQRGDKPNGDIRRDRPGGKPFADSTNYPLPTERNGKMRRMIAMAALAAALAGCTVTKVEYEQGANGETSYRLYRNGHWLKTEAEGLAGGMSKDGTFDIRVEGMKQSPSEEFNRTMQTYTAAFIQLAQIAAAAYSPSAASALQGAPAKPAEAAAAQSAQGSAAAAQSAASATAE